MYLPAPQPRRSFRTYDQFRPRDKTGLVSVDIFGIPTRRGSLTGLGDREENRQKIADVFDSISNAVRGNRSSYSLSQPIPLQNVLLIVGVSIVGYKLIELAVRSRR